MGNIGIIYSVCIVNQVHEAPVSTSEPIAASAVVPMPSVTSAATTTLEIVQATSAAVSIHLWPSCR
jgi:hypothetical protein